MGATTEIKETNIGHAFVGKECQQCNKKFSNKDILNYGNWALDFDTSNDVNFEERQGKNAYGWNLTIWVKNIYHSSCEDAEDDEEEEVSEGKKHTGGLYGIKEVMEGVMESQRRHVERMKELEKNKKENHV